MQLPINHGCKYSLAVCLNNQSVQQRHCISLIAWLDGDSSADSYVDASATGKVGFLHCTSLVQHRKTIYTAAASPCHVSLVTSMLQQAATS